MPLLTVSGAAAAFGLAACCAIPFFLAWLGLSSAWLVGIAIFAFYHRTVFLAVAFLGLAGGATLLWKHRAVLSQTGIGLTSLVLGTGTVLLFYGMTYV